jgi:hypothetical protein
MKNLFITHKRALFALVLGLLTALLAFGIVLANRPTAPQPNLHPCTRPSPCWTLTARTCSKADSPSPPCRPDFSTMQTCGACHDTDFIASHSFHADSFRNRA